MYILFRFLVYSTSHRVDRKLLACKDSTVHTCICNIWNQEFVILNTFILNHNTRVFYTSQELHDSFDKVCITLLHLVNKIDVLVKHKCP